LPLPIKHATTTTNYTPTSIKPKETYTPKEVVPSTSAAPLSYVPSKITEISIFNDQSEEVTEKKKDKKSSSSSSHRRHSSSSSSSHHKSSSRDRHKSSHKSSSSSSHKSSRHKSSSSHSRSSSSSHHKSSSSSNGHKHKSKSKDKDKDREKEKESKKQKIDEEIPDDIDMEEDDIEEQCRMIFETYQPEEQEEVKQPSKSNKSIDESDIYECGKRRQAHENAISVQKPITLRRENHAQSAMVTAQRREEMAIQKAITENKARDEQIAKLEEEISQKEDEMNKTPLVNPLIFVRPPKRPMITPISQRMAIEAAKRKVMELNKAKDLPYRQTIAQTASKSTGEIIFDIFY
jgi:RNA exonuclease 1